MTPQQKFNRISKSIDHIKNQLIHLEALENMVENFEEGNLKNILREKLNKISEKWEN
tara:strand:+ start:300 stop:470 length:171 start_codon:yes stop_codon:yes gene_type:complete